jgi:predicted phage terminase large subunit-like protein
LSDKKGDAYFLSTPKGFNHFYELSELHKQEHDWYYLHQTSYDRPSFDAGEGERIRRTVSSRVYSQEILAEFTNNSASLIQSGWLQRKEYTDSDVNKENFKSICIGVDLAISKKETADYTAIVTTGKQADGKYVVLDVNRQRWTFNEQLQAIIDTATHYTKLHSNTRLNIESVQYQSAMIQELRRTTDLHVMSAPAKGDKITRFGFVEGKYEHGLIFHNSLSRNISIFEKELLDFPAGKHDDMVDALVHSITGHAKEVETNIILM